MFISACPRPLVNTNNAVDRHPSITAPLSTRSGLGETPRRSRRSMHTPSAVSRNTQGVGVNGVWS